ncbi:MAG TPA: lysophospholipid acyltransferase family protein [Kiloniellales bacterium]|nr:lysophospholipid acyltransferase family protein [Kiloniellales bacterium]
MTTLRSLLFNLYFFTWTTLCALFGVPFLLMGYRIANAYGRWWSGTVLWGLRLICGVRGRVEGLEQHLPPGASIVAMKHQSTWETLFAPQILDAPAFVVKRELTRIPFFGWYLLQCRMLPVDRKGGAGALRAMVQAARARKAEARPIVIYPEGTRTAPGTSAPYHPGVAALYQALDLPVVPVALNSGLHWGRHAFRKRPGTIVMRFLEPIPPGLDRRLFLAELQRRIESASTALLTEGGPTPIRNAS